MATTWENEIQTRANGVLYGAETENKPPTTTISTIAVQSGNTRIVIALLQSKEWIQLKIQEMHPAMTDIGANLNEAIELNQQHEKVLEKLQTKQSPVEELLRQADELIATQKPRGEVYSAMAENLGLAWKDLNAQLEQRRQILEQAVAFFTRSRDFSDTLDRIQKNISDIYLPDCTEVCSTMLQRHQEERKVALSCSMHMLKEGQYLLEKLCEVATHSMGDSRPLHMQHAARQTSAFVERHMEALHDRWRHLEAHWTQRKLKLEQCLKKCQFLIEISEVQNWLSIRGIELASQQYLGDSSASAEILQHEHSKAEKESKEIQEQALKLVRTAEQLAYAGNYAGEELKVRAYEVLSECSDLVNMLESRNLLLSMSVMFFNSAQTALNKLDQIEIQLTTSEGVSTVAQKSHLKATIDEIANPVIEEGCNLINRAGSTEPGVQGVVRKVSELKNRWKRLLDLCSTHKAESSEWTTALRNFNNNYEQLLAWVNNSGHGFLQRNRDMGTTQGTASNFVAQHETLQSDLRVKGIEVEALLSTVPSLVRIGGPSAEEVSQKSENLRDLWNRLRISLEKRISIGHSYLGFHKIASKVTKDIGGLESDIKRSSEGLTQMGIRSIEEKILTSQQGILQLKNCGRNFLEDAQKVDDTNLNMALPCSTVQSILDNIESRKVTLTTEWKNWQNQMSTMKDAIIQWEYLVKDSHRVIKCAKELESKMFPVIPRELIRVESILSFLEDRMSVLLPQIKSIQQEMEIFLKKSDVLCPKDKPKPEGQKVIEELQNMNRNFQRKLTDYQILISMMTSYFKSFEELERMVDIQETQFKMTILPTETAKVEAILHDHRNCKPTVLELFKFTYTEAEQVIKKIKEAEPMEAALQDSEKITSIYEARKMKFETLWESHRKTLDQHLQMCIFNSDLHQINQQIADLNSQLLLMKQKYGDSLPNAIATSQAFIQFEKTIEILQLRIQKFVSTAEWMIQEKKVDTSLVHREIQEIQNKWSTFRTEVSNNRHLIDLSIEYFKLLDESEEWLKEGSRLLISIARQSSTCKNAADAGGLHNEIKGFLDKGRFQQEERMRKLTTLSIHIHGNRPHPTSQQLINKNKDMLDSFSVIASELTVLTENIKRAEKDKVKEAKEKEELDAALYAVQAKAEATRSAAAAAQESARAVESAVKTVPYAKYEVAPTVISAKIHAPPKFIVPLSDTEVPEGTKFSFECKVEGYPESQVQWFKDGILAQNNPDYQTKYENGLCILTIEETFSEDSARFTCRATNSMGVAETHGKLLVKETRSADGLMPPHFVKEPADGTVEEGKPFVFECHVSGNPLPLISWFRDDVCIDNSAEYFSTYNNGYCRLSLQEASTGHAGRYTCRAVNQAGQAACSAILQVKTSLPSARPVFETPLSNVMARAGQKLRLECTVTGQPEPQITWLHNSKPIKETRDIKMQFDGRNVNLVITEAFPKDAGIYTVVARNKAGEAVSTCNVSVKGRLPLETSDSEMASDIEPAKPLVKQQLLDQTAMEGSKVRMDCIIVGQPEPEVIWYHNGKPVKESDDFQLLFEGDRCTLIIKVAYLEDAGTYKCVAINSGGEASSQCQLNVQPATVTVEEKSQFTRKDIILTVEKPKPLKFIKLLKDTCAYDGQKIKLECQVVGDEGMSIRWFKDGQELLPSKDYEILTEKIGLTSLTIPSVKPQHQGRFSVLAQNAAGETQSFCHLTVLPSTQAPAPQVPPSFVKHINEQRVNIGQSAKFDGIVAGTPKPKVRWNFEGHLLVNDPFHKIIEDGDKHSLLVPNASKQHAGRYSVVAENNAGIATSSALLHVEEPLSHVTSDSFQEQTAQTMIMSKKTTVVEKCTISSMVDVSEPFEDGPFSIEEKSTFNAIQFEKPASEVSTFTSTSVCHKTTVPPKFIKPLSPTVIIEGEKLLLEGQIEGSPEPEIRWYKDGTELYSMPGLTISSVKGKTSLFMIKTIEQNSGLYSCVATNSAGKATSMAEVKVKPHQEAPKFLKALQGGVFRSGARINLEVRVSGLPQPEVKWYRNNTVLQDSPDFRISSDGNKHLLVIQEAFPDDSGTFMVIASNIAGQAKSTAELIVEEEKSPEEEKVICYQEISSIQQKKEMLTKVSVVKTASVEPYSQPSVTEAKSEIREPDVVKTPSPPPIPAVSSRVWAQTKPELITPRIEQIVSVQDLPQEFPDEQPLVEFPDEVVERKTVDEVKITSDTDAMPLSTSQSFVKQSVMKFSEQIMQPCEVKVDQQQKTETLPHSMQNGTPTKHEPIISTESAIATKQYAFSSETKTQTVHSFSSTKSEVCASSTPVKFTSSVAKEPTETKSPIWKPSQQKGTSSKFEWQSVQVPSSKDVTLASADIVQFQDMSVTPVLETGIVSTTPTVKESFDSKASVHQSFTKFTSEVSETKKIEETVVGKDHTFPSVVKTDVCPKPIIKKESRVDGPKPKKEVVIEEEPVISAEVKPPVFSKVRGTESFGKVA